MVMINTWKSKLNVTIPSSKLEQPATYLPATYHTGVFLHRPETQGKQVHKLPADYIVCFDDYKDSMLPEEAPERLTEAVVKFEDLGQAGYYLPDDLIQLLFRLGPTGLPALSWSKTTKEIGPSFNGFW